MKESTRIHVYAHTHTHTNTHVHTHTNKHAHTHAHAHKQCTRTQTMHKPQEGAHSLEGDGKVDQVQVHVVEAKVLERLLTCRANMLLVMEGVPEL